MSTTDSSLPVNTDPHCYYHSHRCLKDDALVLLPCCGGAAGDVYLCASLIAWHIQKNECEGICLESLVRLDCVSQEPLIITLEEYAGHWPNCIACSEAEEKAEELRVKRLAISMALAGTIKRDLIETFSVRKQPNNTPTKLSHSVMSWRFLSHMISATLKESLRKPETTTQLHHGISV